MVELKIDCSCRKPKPGMLSQVVEDFNIDVSHSWMIGDSENDVLVGKKAGCWTALICDGDCGRDISSKSLLSAIMSLLK